MQVDSENLTAILGMAVVTYATRAGGLWLMSQVTLSPKLATWLRHIPGAVLISIVAPAVVKGGVVEAVAAIATVLMALRTGQLVLAMLTGMSVVWVLRYAPSIVSLVTAFYQV